MMLRPTQVAALILAGGLALGAGQARAAAEVHRLNLVFSLIPSQVDGGDFNRQVDYVNQVGLSPFGLQPLKRITFAWLFDAQIAYFVRSNMTVNVGVGQIRSRTDREYLPAIDQAIQLHGEVLSIPVHVGGTYYLAPYNQGDFQARAYFGAGAMSMVYNRALYQQESQNVPPPAPANVVVSGSADAPGYYFETGAHMFFASSFSVQLGAIYRSAKIKHLVDEKTGGPFLTPQGQPFTLDLSGIGAKLGIVKGF